MNWRWWRQPPLLRVVLVNQKHDSQEAVRGALWQRRGPWLVLRDAAIVRAHGEPQPIDGDVFIPVENVAFLQVLP